MATGEDEVDVKPSAIFHLQPATSNAKTTDHDSNPNNPIKVEHDFEEFCSFLFPEDESLANDASTTEPFYFETDHLALKGNEDYRCLLRVLVTLESQRITAINDLDTLLDLQKRALDNPLEFAKQLAAGKGINGGRCPNRINVAELPNIPWERYTDDVESVLCSLSGSQHSTRQKQKRDLMSGIRERINAPRSMASASGRSSPIAAKLEPMERPATFNQPWSEEEQRQLERLLQKYPPERFESRRFKKIAAELKGRTLQQVASRVQKYFIKLAKAGLPVPGRIPNLAAHGGRGSGLGTSSYQRHQRYNRYYYPSSTFLTSYVPPVYMSEDDDGGDDEVMSSAKFDATVPSASNHNLSSECNTEMATESDNDDSDDVADLPENLRDTPEFYELQQLMAVKHRRHQHQNGTNASATFSFTNMSSVKTEHDSDEQDCARDTNVSVGFPSVSSSHVDPDYTSSKTGISSYLDPNYMPAV